MISMSEGPLDTSQPRMCEITNRGPRIRGESLKMLSGK